MAKQTIDIGTTPNDGTGDALRDAFDKVNDNTDESYLTSRILVNQTNKDTTLGGTIDSTKEYFLDGIIDMGATQIEIPSTGITINGFDFNTSGLTSSENSYTMFVNAVGGSGDVLWKDFKIEVTGTSSQVLDIEADTGFEAFEIDRINFNDCTSIGEIDGYRQGLETGTGRFGGTPNLILSGTWLGGYFIETSIVRSLTDGAYSLYEEGTSFVMNSRFRSNQNIDLPASASFIDFQSSNFTNPSTVQLTEMIISRAGVFDASDSNYTPNINKSDLVSNWSNNNGLPNTFEGGSIGVTTETATTINTIGVFETLTATLWTTNDLQHFDNPSGSQLRHLGNTPREYKIIADLTIDAGSNEVLTVRVVKYDDSAATTSTVLDQTRQVNALVGGRDVAFFSININTELDQNDYIYLEVANVTATTNVTVEVDSYYIIEQR